MEKALGELTAEEFEKLVERTIDRRLEVWLTQLADALIGPEEEKSTTLQPEFAASLKYSLEQARSGQMIELQAFREQIGR